MRVTYVAHATLLVEGEGTNFICDPWLVGEEINNCTVWLYPPRRIGLKDLPKLDFMYISHEHDDHSNLDTLREMAKDIPIYILNFPHQNRVLYQRLVSCGMKNIVTLNSGETHQINPKTKITIFASDEGFVDSSAVIEHNGFTIFHGNDNFLKPSTFAEIGKRFKVDMAFLPYAGFSGFPACYEFPLDVRDHFAEKKKQETVEEFFTNIKALNPRFAVPAAGDLSIIGEKYAWMNYYDRCSPDETVERGKAVGLADRILPMRAGDYFEPGKGLVPHPQREEWGYSIEEQVRFANRPHVKQKIDAYDKWLYDVNNPNLQKDLVAYLEAGVKRFQPLTEKVGNYIFTVRTTGPMRAAATVDFATGKVVPGFAENYTKKISLDGAVLYRIMRQDFLWGDAFSSCKLTLDRRPPGNYNRAFWHWLYSLDGLNFYQQRGEGRAANQ